MDWRFPDYRQSNDDGKSAELITADLDIANARDWLRERKP